MQIIHTNQRNKSKNKKPGWKKEQEEYQKWLDGINALSCFGDKRKLTPTNKPPKKQELQQETKKHKSLGEFVKGGTGKSVVDPRILYKDNPEMLVRELKARERKFTAAPLYNKGAEMLVTDELMKDIMSGATRRRS